MSHPERLHAHVAFLRARIAVLQHGDEEARKHVAELEAEIAAIERRLRERT